MRVNRKKPAAKRARVSDPIEQTSEPAKRNDQSGDLQGLPELKEADSESVRELAEEGQSFEAHVIDAVENAPDPDVAQVRTREVPEDDVPPEYLPER